MLRLAKAIAATTVVAKTQSKIRFAFDFAKSLRHQAITRMLLILSVLALILVMKTNATLEKHHV